MEAPARLPPAHGILAFTVLPPCICSPLPPTTSNPVTPCPHHHLYHHPCQADTSSNPPLYIARPFLPLYPFASIP